MRWKQNTDPNRKRSLPQRTINITLVKQSKSGEKVWQLSRERKTDGCLSRSRPVNTPMFTLRIHYLYLPQRCQLLFGECFVRKRSTRHKRPHCFGADSQIVDLVTLFSVHTNLSLSNETHPVRQRISLSTLHVSSDIPMNRLYIYTRYSLYVYKYKHNTTHVFRAIIFKNYKQNIMFYEGIINFI